MTVIQRRTTCRKGSRPYTPHEQNNHNISTRSDFCLENVGDTTYDGPLRRTNRVTEFCEHGSLSNSERDIEIVTKGRR